MLLQYLDTQLKKARYKLLDDGSYFGEIPDIKGVWSNAKTLEDCRQELREVVEEWLLLKIHDGESVPGLPLKTDRRTLVEHAF